MAAGAASKAANIAVARTQVRTDAKFMTSSAVR
jgi:hypothetical protein